MIRLRLKKFVKVDELLNDGYCQEVVATNISVYTKNVGRYQIQIKKSFPTNIRIKDWDDNRTPWILMKFLLDLEAGLNVGNQIKVWDKNRFYILNVPDTLELIKELNKFTDIKKRLTHWYSEFLRGEFRP
jgi:hypothetical protein